MQAVKEPPNSRAVVGVLDAEAASMQRAYSEHDIGEEYFIQKEVLLHQTNSHEISSC